MKRLFDLKKHFQAFREIVSLLTKYRQLTWEMTRREISDRYAGQVFGRLWVIGHPLILMAIYVFIFVYVFKVKIASRGAFPVDYTTYLLSGLIPWMSFQESMAKSSTVIINNANLVKQTVFPIEVLPVKGVIASSITQFVATFLLLMYVFTKAGSLTWMHILIPVVFIFQLMAMAGVSYILSVLGVYLRDTKDFVQVFCVAGLYIMPVFYLPDMVPKIFKGVLYLNPFSYMSWCYQDIFYFCGFQHPWAWFIFPAGSLFVFCAGYALFARFKIMFGDLL
ncbi:MAG: ABC transporter permease [Candidatus Omnitrophota bacterium]